MSEGINLEGKVGFLGIDVQNDFLGYRDKSPFQERRPFRDPFVAALAVPGGKESADAATKFVERMGQKVKLVLISEDRHILGHSATPRNWRHRDGHVPSPFSELSASEVGNATWRFGNDKENSDALAYLTAYEAKGGKHIIWPEHCVDGTWGARTYSPLLSALGRWESHGGVLIVHGKGRALIEEHFGMFWAEVQNPKIPSTMPNEVLLSGLKALDRIIACGLALDYCVRRSIEQLLEYHGEVFAKKLVILTDCTAAIDPKAGEAFLARMRELGATVTTSDKLFVN